MRIEPGGILMEQYEVIIEQKESYTFKVFADNEKDAISQAFKNFDSMSDWEKLKTHTDSDTVLKSIYP